MNASIRRRAVAALATAGIAGMILAGCSAPPETGGGDAGAEGSDFLACAVSDEGSWNDKSFNEAAYGGMLKAEKDLGIKISDAESHTPEDFEPNLTAMVDAGCDVIFGVGFNLVDPLHAAAKANPESNFVTIDGFLADDTITNLKPVMYDTVQSSYLAGYVSAAYSTTKIVGTYGGMNIPAVTDFMVGFYNGAKAYEADTGELVTVVGFDPANPDAGDYVGDFQNKETAKSISVGQIEQGADVILPVAGGLFSATSEAINESGKPVVMLGVDKNVAETSPEYADQILTSIEKLMTQAVYDVIEETMQDGFNAEAYIGTLENDGTRISPFGVFDDKISAEIKTKLDELKAGIIDGSIDPKVTP
ncbi:MULTISPECIES: BMP family ABC transporter substrate-binding protein [unclassified Leucobacter]|uniref:BMP family lipoprotein n=1 Tax=unclassified Leucobacter TaxID=2621730 RepID=UPI00165DDC65|nr:BMP family ABC transporter substrate-binding protein [Leucobacter sp. cx-87]